MDGVKKELKNYMKKFFVVGELAIYVFATAVLFATWLIATTIKFPAGNLEPVSK